MIQLENIQSYGQTENGRGIDGRSGDQDIRHPSALLIGKSTPLKRVIRFRKRQMRLYPYMVIDYTGGCSD